MRLVGIVVGLLLLQNSICTGQTSSAAVRKDTKAQYQIIKGVYAKQYPATKSANIRPNLQIIYDLNDCAAIDPTVISKDRRTSQLAGLAAEIQTSSSILKWIGYPDATWQIDLSNYESAQIDSISKTGSADFQTRDRAAKVLLKKLDQYRASSRTRLARVQWETACGGSGRPITVRTIPPGGKLKFIPILFYVFCSSQGINAQNLSECNQWIETSDGEDILVNGVYFYRAEWVNGSKTEGRKDIDKIPDSNSQIFWTVRASGD